MSREKLKGLINKFARSTRPEGVARTAGALGCFTEPCKLFLDLLQVFVRQVFKIDKVIARALEGTNEFVQFRYAALASRFCVF